MKYRKLLPPLNTELCIITIEVITCRTNINCDDLKLNVILCDNQVRRKKKKKVFHGLSGLISICWLQHLHQNLRMSLSEPRSRVWHRCRPRRWSLVPRIQLEWITLTAIQSWRSPPPHRHLQWGLLTHRQWWWRLLPPWQSGWSCLPSTLQWLYLCAPTVTCHTWMRRSSFSPQEQRPQRGSHFKNSTNFYILFFFLSFHLFIYLFIYLFILK